MSDNIYTFTAPTHFFINTDPPSRLIINGANNKPMVNILRDGTIEFGENYTPDEAARIFWQCIGDWPAKAHAAEVAALRAALAKDKR